MRRALALFLFSTAIAAAALAVSLWALLHQGLSARRKPAAIESLVARRLRLATVPAEARRASNPVDFSSEALREARRHFADHCALCHGNDGSGDTEIGRGLYPPPPDLRRGPTQSLSDGEIFYAIHEGIAFTGMPAWGEPSPARDLDSWRLVHFIRHLPRITADEIAEMEKLNPKSPEERSEEEEARRFLEGRDTAVGQAKHLHR
jgi:mono/diheme cytochrome c family protein